MKARSTPKLDLSIWSEIGRVLYLPNQKNGAAAMSSTIKTPAMPEPVGYTDKSWLAAKGGGQFSRRSFPGMQLPLHTAAQLAARDAQWKEGVREMVGPLLKELKDAATSLETIGRLAGVAEYVGDDGERIPTYMGRGDQIRGYAASRAAVARSALSAITEE